MKGSGQGLHARGQVGSVETPAAVGQRSIALRLQAIAADKGAAADFDVRRRVKEPSPHPFGS
jgi:hypothetical protein